MSRWGNRLISLFSAPLSSGPALAASRLFFGNNAGARQNIVGRWELAQARLTGNTNSSPQSEHLARQYRRDGFVLSNDILPPGLFSALRDKAQTLLAGRERLSGSYMASIGSPEIELLLPELLDVAAEIKPLVEQIYDGPSRFHSGLIWKTFPVPPDRIFSGEVYSDHWHNDSGRVSNIAAFVLLCDVDIAHGPMHFVSKQRTRALMRMGYKHRGNYSVPEAELENESQVQRLTGKAGTVLLMSTSECLHRASIPQTDFTREMMRIDFFPRNAR